MTQIELACGSLPTQIIRAIIPVADSCFTGPNFDPVGAWHIEDVPAQFDVVTRKWNGCPDTIEVIASGVSKNPNGLANYNITFREGEAQPANGSFSDLPAFNVELVDEQNKLYNWHPDNSTVVQNGAYKKVTRYNGTLQSRTGTNLFGVVVFATQYVGENMFEFDIDFNNGLVEQVIGNVYFRSLAIILEDNYKLLPRMGSQRPCGRSTNDKYFVANRSQYFWPKQGHLHRRFIAYNPDSINRKLMAYKQKFGGLGFNLDWANAFGVSKTGLGSVTNDMRYWGFDGHAYYGREGLRHQGLDLSNTLDYALRSGNAVPGIEVYSTALGPFHPYFLPAQGVAGGFGIHHYSGYRLCVEDFAAQACIHGMNSERQPFCMYYINGRPKNSDDFAAENNGVIPFNFAPMDYQVNNVPAFLNAADYNHGTAGRDIETWAPHDSSHQCRYIKPMQALIYLGNDWLAKRHAEMMAEVDTLYLNTHQQHTSWGVQNNLTTMLAIAHEDPHEGGLLGRTKCWPVDAIMAYYSVAPQDWRTRMQPWIQSMAQCIVLSQMPTGWNNRNLGDSGDQVVVTAGLPEEYDIGQTFEIEFEDWIKRCLWINMDPADRLRTDLMQSVLLSATTFFTSAVYNGNSYRWFIAVGENHGEAFTPPQLQYELTSGNAETFQGWFVLNHAYLAAQELQDTSHDWLAIALTYAGSVPNRPAKIVQLSQWASDEWNNHLYQSMGLMRTLADAN
jgi:hypothetical protein